MQRKNILLLSGVLMVVVGAAAGIAYNDTGPSKPTPSAVKWLTFDEGLLQAKNQNKKLLVDVYTDWCGWCKKMDAEVYTDASVAGILKDHFIAVKLNAESNARLRYDDRVFTNAQFSQALGITGFPSTVFFRSDGKPITVVPGYVEADNFASILTYIGNDHYQSMSFDEFQSTRP